MNERQIKNALRVRFAMKPRLSIVEELPVCGHSARADFVTIGKTLSGYEIKSDRDSLTRLADQIKYYDQVFELSSIVAAERHIKSVRQILPAHWGVIRISNSASQQFETLQEPTLSPNLCGTSILELLWTDELLSIVANQGWTGVRKSWGREKLRTFIAARSTPQQAIQFAIVEMKLRQHWRAA